MDILVVDDSRIMRTILQRAIRQAGYRGLEIAEAGNAKEAMDKLHEGRPRLILSDWNMPEMSGLEFLQQLRATENSVPFGFVTSEASVEMRSLALSSGATFMLSKPFTPDDIQNAISPILD
jgi:Response regulator containing CheY-like receiver, AAA-type ATPase, and DNA-binding domains